MMTIRFELNTLINRAYSSLSKSLSVKKSWGDIFTGFLLFLRLLMPAFSTLFKSGDMYAQLRYVKPGGSVNFERLLVIMFGLKGGSIFKTIIKEDD